MRGENRRGRGDSLAVYIRKWNGIKTKIKMMRDRERSVMSPGLVANLVTMSDL